jgi:hypothetical protein
MYYCYERGFRGFSKGNRVMTGLREGKKACKELRTKLVGFHMVCSY